MGISSGVGNVGLVPVGVVVPFAGSTSPAGWELCYGQAISRTTYAGLFATISTNYGSGDGSTTFNVPDLRGRTVAGLDNMGGTDAGRLTTVNIIGTTTGTETITLTSAEMPSHTHTQDAHSHAVQRSNQAATSLGSDASALYTPQANTGSPTYFTTQNATATNQNTGGGGSHNNMQPTMTINYIIKAA